MRRLLAVILAFTIWFSIAPVASADDQTAPPLVPCSQSPAFQRRAASAALTTDDPNSGRNRFERYSKALCGPEGLPHLIVDGRLNRAGEFIIPSLLFLYIAGWIGWVGRMYVIWAKKAGGAEEKEIIIDVPKAIGFMLSGFTWPLLALKEFSSGELIARDDEITVSPR